MSKILPSDLEGEVDGGEYVLRISSPYCNLRCRYCRVEDFKDVDPISESELLDVISASVECGIRRVRWTGGEPTVTPNFINIVRTASGYGIENQMLSSNGVTLYRMAEELKDAGIDRVNISLDTLDREMFAHVTGLDRLHDVIRSVEASVDTFDLVKINRVLERGNVGETIQLLEFAHSYSGRKAPLVVRFIELVKGGFTGDLQYVEQKHCSGDDVIEIARREFGHLSATSVEGDNPMCYYYTVDATGVVIGIVPNFSVDFQCGGEKCKKIRMNPTGFISNCSIYQNFGHEMKGTTYQEKVAIMSHLIREKQTRDETVFSKLRHHQSDYQFWRFGKARSENIEDRTG